MFFGGMIRSRSDVDYYWLVLLLTRASASAGAGAGAGARVGDDASGIRTRRSGGWREVVLRATSSAAQIGFPRTLLALVGGLELSQHERNRLFHSAVVPRLYRQWAAVQNPHID